MAYRRTVLLIAVKRVFRNYFHIFAGIFIFDVMYLAFGISQNINRLGLIIFLAASLLLAIFLFFRLLFASQKYLLAYSLKLGDNAIYINNVNLSLDNILSIMQNANGDLIINSAISSFTLVNGMGEFDKAKALLLTRFQIERKDSITKLAFSVIALLSFPIFLFIKTSFIVIPLGIILILFYAILIYSLIKEKANFLSIIIQIIFLLIILIKTYNYLVYIRNIFGT